MNNVLLSSLLIISSIFLSNLAFHGIRKRKVPGAFVFSLLMMAMVVHSVGYAFELLTHTVENMYFWIRIEYIGASFYPFLIMLFAREYTDEKKLASKYLLTLILTVNVVTLVLVNTNSYHLMYYSSVGIDSSPGFNVLALEKGIWYFVHVGSLYFSILYSIIIFSIKLKKSKGNYRRRATYTLIGAAIPMITFIIYMFDLGPVYIDLTPLSYFIMSIFITIGLFRDDILFFTPITHEMIFNSIDEAVLVIDKEKLLVSFNRASQLFFPSLKKIKIGQPISLVSQLKDYDFHSNPEIHHIDDKIFSFKVINMRNNKVSIYVVNDITESERAKKQLEILAREDALTGLYNRRHFIETFERSEKEGVFGIIDIDHFKSINDTFGHYEGDNVLSYFGKELKDFFSEYMTCRYGGEEFAVFIEDMDVQQVFEKIEVLRTKIKDKEGTIKFTFSAGLAEYKRGELSKTIIKADKKLYEAKENGRDQTRY